MKIKTALITILISFFFVLTPVFAQQFGVDIGADITVDLYSQVDVNPSTVEILSPSQVNIKIQDSDGVGLEGRNVEIFINGDDTGVTITQPQDTDSFGETSGSVSFSEIGTYEVCVKDLSEEEDIYVEDCEAIFVIPVPVPELNSEPQYTKGDSNTVSWTHNGEGNYEYQVEVSNTSGFNTILRTTSWIENTAYIFDNLSNSQIYFYHVRARNEYGGISSWSDYEFSIQDDEDPEITLLDISDVEDNTIEKWDNLFRVYFKFKIEDNTGIDSKEFYCVTQDGSPVECDGSESSNGDLWTIGIQLGDLETDGDYNLFEEYDFCLEATDVVGNVNRFCNILLSFEHYDGDEPDDVIPPPVQETKDTIEEVIEDIVEIIENVVGDLNPEDIQLVTVTTSVTTIAFGLSALLTGLGSLPYAILEIILSILSFFGFRKKQISEGYVYDSVTKEPVPLAVVRIYDENASLVWTDVTNKEGYFKSTELPDGEYYISVTARNFVFPSKIVFGKEDFPLKNVYHGDTFEIKEGEFPVFAIPVDSEEIKVVRSGIERFKVVLKTIFMFFHLGIFLFGLLFAMYAVMVNPLWWNYLILVLYIPSSILLVRNILGLGYENKWGIVKDTAGTLFEGVIVGLTDVKKDKLISKRVTDEEGKYRFVVGKGDYRISVLNSDLKLITEVEDITLRKKSTRSVIAEDLIVDDINLEEIKKNEKEEVIEPLDVL